MTDSTIDLAGYTWNAFQQRKQRNVATMLDDTAEALGLDVRDLLNAALRKDASTELLHQALTAAADTVNDQKVKALTRSLANGLLNDAALVDQESLVVRALADLDSVHVKLLAIIAEP